MHNRIVLKEY